jgi:hypothetical protein
MLSPEGSEDLPGIHLDLARCYRARGGRIAALASVAAAREVGATAADVADLETWLGAELGEPLARWRELTSGR